MPTSTSKKHINDAWRGAAEGAALGFIIVLVRLAREWWAGADPDAFTAHLGEIGVYSAAVITSMAFVFGVGRAISGGWSGALAGAFVLGLGGLWLAAQAFRPAMVGPPIGLFAGLGAGGAVGAVLGALIERRVRLRRGGTDASAAEIE